MKGEMHSICPIFDWFLWFSRFRIWQSICFKDQRYYVDLIYFRSESEVFRKYLIIVIGFLKENLLEKIEDSSGF